MNVKQTAQQKAKQAAQLLARESLEVLKSAREQVAPTPEIAGQQQDSPKQGENKENIEKSRETDKAKSAQMMRAYEAELLDIRRSEVFKDLQKRISEGEDIPVENYTELTMEQKQVLMAQKEAAAARRDMTEQGHKEVPQVSSKKGRKTFGNIGLKRSQVQVEMRQPPSS